MKLIGVTGKSGAGKTTFSNILAQKHNIGVIHVDDILRQIKLKYFQPIMSKDKSGENTKVNSKLKRILYGNKILFNLFMKFRAKLVEKPLQQNIDNLIKEGKEVILIDDIFLKHQKVYKDLSMIFMINRPYIERRKALKERDNLKKEELIAYDTAHFKRTYKEIIEGKNVRKIINNGSKEELEDIAEQIYEQYFIGFKERYKQKEEHNKSSIERTIVAIRDIKNIDNEKEQEQI